MFITYKEYLNYQNLVVEEYINKNILNIDDIQIGIDAADIQKLLTASKVTTILHFQVLHSNCKHEYFSKTVHTHINNKENLIVFVTSSPHHTIFALSTLLTDTGLFAGDSDTNILGIAYDDSLPKDIIDFKVITFSNESSIFTGAKVKALK